jgi:hypothetical protein
VIGFSVSDLLEFINEAERKETKMENSKHKTHQTKVTSDHCYIFVGDFSRIVYLFVWYNFLCILGCFSCRWKSCFTQCVVVFFWWQPSQSKGQWATSLLVPSPSSRPSSPDEFNKEAAMFLVSDEEEKSMSDYSRQEATTVATSTVAARVILQPPPPHHVQTDPILQNSGRNHCCKLWVVENCEEDEEEGWQEVGPKGRVSVASTSRLSTHKSGVNGLSQNYSGGGGGSVQNGVHHRYDAGILRGGNVIHQEKGNHNNQVPRKKKPVNGSILPLLTSSSVGIIRKQISTGANNQDRGSLSKIASYSHVSIPKKETIAHQVTHSISHKQDRSSKNKTAGASATTQVTTTTTQYGGAKHMLLDNTSRASKAAAAASTCAGRTMFSYKDVVVAQPGTHTSIWPELEHLTATTSNEKSEEPVTSEKLLPKKQTTTPMMSDSEKSGKISPEEAEVAVSKEVTADATTPMTTDLTVAQPSLDDTSETHIAIIASSYTTAAAPLIVEVSDTNVSPTSNDDSETCSLHESVEETVVAAAAVSNKRASVEMRENADAEDEVKDYMAHNKLAAAIDDCKSSDDNEMLSAEAPSFNHDNAPGLVPTTVAMTPFKDGKGSPLNGLPVSLPVLSNITNTAAVTPIHTSPPPLAPLPQVRFIMAAAGPQYIMPHQPGCPSSYLLTISDCQCTDIITAGNGPYMAPIFAPFRSVPMNPNAEEFYPWYMREQSQSTLTFSPIPAYSPIPEIVADADEIISQRQYANAAAADTEDTTGPIRVGKQAVKNSECKQQSSDGGGYTEVESSQETLTEVETETSDEDDGTLCSQQSDEEEEEQTVVEIGNDN